MRIFKLLSLSFTVSALALSSLPLAATAEPLPAGFQSTQSSSLTVTSLTTSSLTAASLSISPLTVTSQRSNEDSSSRARQADPQQGGRSLPVSKQGEANPTGPGKNNPNSADPAQGDPRSADPAQGNTGQNNSGKSSQTSPKSTTPAPSPSAPSPSDPSPSDSSSADPAPSDPAAPKPPASSQSNKNFTPQYLAVNYAATSDSGFSDLGAGAFSGEARWAKDKGVARGYKDGTLRPKELVSRASMAVFMYRLAGEPKVDLSAPSPFKDLKPTTTFYKEIIWAYQNGITTGYADKTFRPWESINRDAILVFLYRTCKLGLCPANMGTEKLAHKGEAPFTDMWATPFKKEVTWAWERGLVTGYCDGYLNPDQKVERIATIAFTYRAFNNTAPRDPETKLWQPCPFVPNYLAVSYAGPRASGFSDLGAGDFSGEAWWAQAKGIAKGNKDGSLKPHEQVSRAAVAVFMYRLAGSPKVEVSKTSPFKDLPTSNPFYKEIIWAYQNGITTGYADKTFRPWDTISRDAILVFLYRTCKLGVCPASMGTQRLAHWGEAPFTDMWATPFKTEVTWAWERGLVTGYCDGYLNPGNTVERIAAIAFIYRVFHNKTARDPGATLWQACPHNPWYHAQAGERWIEVDLTNHLISAYEGNKLVHGPIRMVDGAPWTPTVTGYFRIYIKRRLEPMSGLNPDGTPYYVPNVPYSMYFHGLYAIHGAWWRSDFTYTPASGSHGCVNLPVHEAEWFWHFADYGTVVVSHR